MADSFSILAYADVGYSEGTSSESGLLPIDSSCEVAPRRISLGSPSTLDLNLEIKLRIAISRSTTTFL